MLFTFKQCFQFDEKLKRFFLDFDAFSHFFQGLVKRRSLIKDGNRPIITMWKRYWMQIWGDALVLYATRLFSQVQTLEYRKVIIDFPKLLIFFRERRESISDMILANMSQQVMFTSTLQFYYCKKKRKNQRNSQNRKDFFSFSNSNFFEKFSAIFYRIFDG